MTPGSDNFFPSSNSNNFLKKLWKGLSNNDIIRNEKIMHVNSWTLIQPQRIYVIFFASSFRSSLSLPQSLGQSWNGDSWKVVGRKNIRFSACLAVVKEPTVAKRHGRSPNQTVQTAEIPAPFISRGQLNLPNIQNCSDAVKTTKHTSCVYEVVVA